ncbi:IclR family transcriptional regulator [Microbacterium sp. 2FI]|uniref:IclR family transcriptional regulator n=1 Tax=Microbacterium sp. 2FI TaxID=2502193 RepID=UPI0010F7AF3B|nr:IclR family transcriptional regulator [Microbacterium sp. 2FI]
MEEKAPASQTLSRGIRILETLADAREPLSIDDVAHHLGVHRSVAYRLVRTLEEHGLVVRDGNGRLALGARMAALAAGVAHDLQAEALPELTAAANDLGMTCFLSILDRDECVTLASVEPRHAVASVAQRPGTRHPVTVGAPGKAILSLVAEPAWPADLDDEHRAEVRLGRERGWATSHDEVIAGLRSIAVPLTLPTGERAAIAVVYLSDPHPDADIAARLTAVASAIRSAIGG